LYLFLHSIFVVITDKCLPELNRWIQIGTLSKLEHDSTNLLSYFASNNLPVNDDKTTFILFGPDKSLLRKQQSITVGNAQISSQSSVKILGVTLSNNCSWNDHLGDMIAKLKYRLYIIRHLRCLLPQKALEIVSEGIFTSQIRYCLPLFFRPRLSDQDPIQEINSRLQKAHNEMIRTVYGLKKSDKINMSKLRTEKNIMSINQMLCQASINEMRKVLLYGTIPSVKCEPRPSENYSIITRSQAQSKLIPPKSRLARTASGFPTQAIKLWNSLPANLRCEDHSDARFKVQAKKWITSSGIP